MITPPGYFSDVELDHLANETTSGILDTNWREGEDEEERKTTMRGVSVLHMTPRVTEKSVNQGNVKFVVIGFDKLGLSRTEEAFRERLVELNASKYKTTYFSFVTSKNKQ